MIKLVGCCFLFIYKTLVELPSNILSLLLWQCGLYLNHRSDWLMFQELGDRPDIAKTAAAVTVKVMTEMSSKNQTSHIS